MSAPSCLKCFCLRTETLGQDIRSYKLQIQVVTCKLLGDLTRYQIFNLKPTIKHST